MSTSTKPKSTSLLPNTGEKPAMFQAQKHFTMAGMAALSDSTFAQDFGNNECQAAIRAMLRHGAHLDGAHYHTRTPGGLHPAYAVFNPHNKSDKKLLSRTDLVEASLSDVFDAITIQDRLDGGISLLI
ncbi:hypothetical protein PAXRUDRAFT_18648 [Paxillus rubicundulus Ve08.2h10]|uniref:Uncharacterized protein n=1 Tax=Paxillus rubicundulus Ve08.2h10 TaxID=930991 RepID=A0A0D0BX41_9AGAM|nr:hypothetical protein PAXRUDRAFT_18648 [Paxillus rubicundulus Ve08.2h10]